MGSFLFNNTEHNINNATHSKSISELGYLQKTIYSLIISICIPGIIGNVIVTRLLYFQTKRNPFTVYILNLAVADTGTLLFVFISAIQHLTTKVSLTEIIEGLLCTYCTGQFLLTIISTDRCLAVFFPIWHRCHQPPNLPTILCAFSWIISILFCTIHYTMFRVTGLQEFLQFSFHFLILIFTSVCIPVMVVSSLALFIKGYIKSQTRKKLLTTIFLALLFFLLLSLPMNVFYVIHYFKSYNLLLMTIGIGCAILNSSINPLLYFLVGRKKRGKDQHRGSYKVALQRVFKDETGSWKSRKPTEDQL
uniref:G-protein coupled receptors family 1 profile domain-containing protein n=1 Tax=Naja naja TaxID=35670 RepID=A0A8C6XB25_NAJNA